LYLCLFWITVFGIFNVYLGTRLEDQVVLYQGPKEFLLR
jgi:hypothetical protein